MGDGVETRVESAASDLSGRNAGFSVRMLGPLTIARGEEALDLPASRKTRALFAFLALSSEPVSRGRLCDLLWDVPNDPRAELRWCLSKLRAVLDEPGLKRVRTDDETIALHLDGCFVDAIEVSSAIQAGVETLELKRLRRLADLFVGDFLDGLEIDRQPRFTNWLMAQRRRFRDCHAALLEHLVKDRPDVDADQVSLAERWIELAPFDARAHANLLAVLLQRSQIEECEDHFAAVTRSFESEGLDPASLVVAWRTLKDRKPSAAARSENPASSSVAASQAVGNAPSRRASLAVMPFIEEANGDGVRGRMADGLTHDIITRLAKLRDLFIIARGSVFALAESGVAPEDAGRRLNVEYVASGAISSQDNRVRVAVELVEVRTATIVWTEDFDRKAEDVFTVLDEIGDSIVSAISAEIEMVERNRAILKAPNSLNAWEAYHRGLWHMYRFTQSENALAERFLEAAVRQDPMFARAYAALSFTHWQSAFQGWGDRRRESELAFETAGHSLLVDDNNPAAHWAMGRALWLRGRQDDSLRELERSVDLSPNFALGHYALSFVHSQSGDPIAAIESSDYSRRLSPFDPLLFGMLGARAMAHVRLGEFGEAADWALKAAARPNAHANILAIAAHCLALAGRLEEGKAFSASIRSMLPQYTVEDFLTSFRFTAEAADLFRQGARRIGLDGV